MANFSKHQSETQRWVNWQTSNFEYLLLLNRLSGRDFCDLQNYPIFPYLDEKRNLAQTVTGTSRYNECPMTAELASQFISHGFATSPSEVVPEGYGLGDVQTVYANRQKLESLDVSADLSKWITLIWSSDFASGIASLFPGVHPPRNPHPPQPPFNAVTVVTVHATIDHAFIVSQNADDFTMRYLSINQEILGDIKVTSRTSVPLIRLPIAVPDGKCRCFGDYCSHAGFLNAESQLIFIDSRTSKAYPLSSLASCFASADRWLAVGRSDSSLSVYRDSELFWEVSLYREAVVAVAVSDQANVVAVMMKDSSLVICSLVNGAVVHAINLVPKLPRSLLVTPAWGFVVVHATEIVAGILQNYVTVFTINGEKVSQVAVGVGIDAWCCWKSSNGFDYLALAGEKGAIYVADVMHLEKKVLVSQLPNPVVTVAFVESCQVIIAVSELGTIAVVPFMAE
jgi:hypothetical protein